MSKMCQFISDNTPDSEPNILTIVQRYELGWLRGI